MTSPRFSMAGNSLDSGFLFLIDEILASRGVRRVYSCEDIDVAVVFEQRGGTLKLLDVVGREIPDLHTLLRCWRAAEPGRPLREELARVLPLRMGEDRLAFPVAPCHILSRRSW